MTALCLGSSVRMALAQTNAVPPLPLPAPGTAASVEIPNDVLAWDTTTNAITVKLGASETRFTFNVTNVSPATVIINGVASSCGCTVAKLPSEPWVMAPGTNGQIHVTMDLLGRIGTTTKTITISSDKGVKQLSVTTTITLPPGPMTERERNRQMASADRQRIFRADCARCHAEPAKGKLGQELYAASCGICHDAGHRATMVPDLRALNHQNSAAAWRLWITQGKSGSLMPAFALSEGGNLTDEQIASLVDYLVKTIPPKTN